jgi:hypothetical protein
MRSRAFLSELHITGFNKLCNIISFKNVFIQRILPRRSVLNIQTCDGIRRVSIWHNFHLCSRNYQNRATNLQSKVLRLNFHLVPFCRYPVVNRISWSNIGQQSSMNKILPNRHKVNAVAGTVLFAADMINEIFLTRLWSIKCLHFYVRLWKLHSSSLILWITMNLKFLKWRILVCSGYYQNQSTFDLLIVP